MRLTECEQLPPTRQRRWSEVPSTGKWQQDRDELLKAEKEATRALDALAARRRRLPMGKFDNTRYVSGTSAGLAALAGGGVGWATVSSMPLAQIGAYKARMGWTMPFVSSHGTTFADDCGAGGGFMLSVFLRDGEDVYRTYCTTARGVDRLLFVSNILDLTPYGRQEDWEDSPPGWPQHPTYG